MREAIGLTVALLVLAMADGGARMPQAGTWHGPGLLTLSR